MVERVGVGVRGRLVGTKLMMLMSSGRPGAGSSVALPWESEGV
jgi:hypothetical protein